MFAIYTCIDKEVVMDHGLKKAAINVNSWLIILSVFIFSQGIGYLGMHLFQQASVFATVPALILHAATSLTLLFSDVMRDKHFTDNEYEKSMKAVSYCVAYFILSSILSVILCLYRFAH